MINKNQTTIAMIEEVNLLGTAVGTIQTILEEVHIDSLADDPPRIQLNNFEVGGLLIALNAVGESINFKCERIRKELE